MQGVFARGMRGYPEQDENDVRALRVAIANNLPMLKHQVIERLKTKGVGVAIATDGYITVVPLTKEAEQFNERIKNLVHARNLARAAKNFAEADRIRGELAAMGVVLKDSKDGTTWEVAR
jgi:cysteinyl-tRNA synthetase